MSDPSRSDARRRFVLSGGILAGSVLGAALIVAQSPSLDCTAERWVDKTLSALTLDQKVGQLLVPSFESTYVSSDSDTFDRLTRLVREQHVGGFHVFGGSQPAPSVLLNPAYGTVTLGQTLAAASLLNRLQAQAALPLLVTADFEAGPGFRVAGATTFPRAMAFGAAGDERLAFEAGRITAVESRAMGIHVNFAPVVDVNNNARNPVINTRAFGQDPARVSALAVSYARGLAAGGMIATLKHFPGHGDTDVDSHLGLPVITHSRDRLDQIELVPFRAGIAAGVGAVMTAHIELPALDSTPATPTTLSRPAVTGLLRKDLGFGGLVYTDSMDMHAVTKMMSAGEAAVRAIAAGNDLLLHSTDDAAAHAAIRKAIEDGRIDRAQVDASVRRILTAKAQIGLTRDRMVSLDKLPTLVGTRDHAAVADDVSRRSITLIKDERKQVPLRVSREASVLYLSVIDYPSGWAIAAPSRTFQPELAKRWPKTTAIELSDRTTPGELELVRVMAPRFDAVVVGTFVRTASFSGRMDLAPEVVQLLRHLAKQAEQRSQPFVAVLFGNPYAATFLGELPAMLLTYDFYDRAEASAVRAIAGETPIGGRLPIALPGMYEIGHGLDRAAVTPTAAK